MHYAIEARPSRESPDSSWQSDQYVTCTISDLFTACGAFAAYYNESLPAMHTVRKSCAVYLGKWLLISILCTGKCFTCYHCNQAMQLYPGIIIATIIRSLIDLVSCFCVSAILPAEVTSAPRDQKQIRLNSSALINGRYACPGQNVIFTCVVTNGAIVLSWRSDQYIHTNTPLEFSAFEHEVGDTKSQGTTVATLTKVIRNRIFQSQLQLIASPDIPTASITCSNQIDNATINFNLLGEY